MTCTCPLPTCYSRDAIADGCVCEYRQKGKLRVRAWKGNASDNYVIRVTKATRENHLNAGWLSNSLALRRYLPVEHDIPESYKS
jgi:hypothetical protein